MTELQMFCISVLRLTFKSENPCFVYLCSKTYVKRICVVHMCSRIYVMALCFQAKQLFGVNFLQPTLPVHHSSDSISMSGSLVQAELNCSWFSLRLFETLVQISSSPSLELINGVVTPDLPIDATLVEYLNTFNMKKLQKSLKQLIAKERETEQVTPVSSQVGISGGIQGFNCWQVKTVAAQTRSEPEIRERIIKSAREIEEGECGGSLLLLSGGINFSSPTTNCL